MHSAKPQLTHSNSPQAADFRRFVFCHHRKATALLLLSHPKSSKNPSTYRSENLFWRKWCGMQGKSAANPNGFASILTQQTRHFPKINRVRMRQLWFGNSSGAAPSLFPEYAFSVTNNS